MRHSFSIIIFFMLLLFSGCSTSPSIDDNNPNKICILYKPVKKGSIKVLPSGVSVLKKNGKYYLGGDVILTKAQLENLSKYGSLYKPGDSISLATSLIPVTNMPIRNNKATRGVGLIPIDHLHATIWAMPRYVYDQSLSPRQRALIKQAILNIQSKTNVRFFNATGLPTRDDNLNYDFPYINFRYIGESDFSNSMVGCVGGKQDINLADFAFEGFDTGVIEHEICHALGMYHEQSRSDRDNYVTINYSNLTEIGKLEFQKITENYQIIGEYGFNSVMGYNSFTGSKSIVKDINKPMYTKKDGTNIEQGRTLSDTDRKWLNYFYLPYIARTDDYLELDRIVYNRNNERLSEEERIRLQARLNHGNPTPPKNGRIKNDL